MLLIMEYWINGPLPNDDKKLAEITKISKFLWKKLRKNLLNFFDVSENFLHHKRIDEELKKREQAIEKYGENTLEISENCDVVIDSLIGLKSKATPKTLKTKPSSKSFGREQNFFPTWEEDENFAPDWLKKETWETCLRRKYRR